MNLPAKIPKRVRIVEVGPRDGLQNEAAIVSTEDKVRFVELLTDAGLVDIEVSSFVNPKRVPQLADAAEVFARLAAVREQTAQKSLPIMEAPGAGSSSLPLSQGSGVGSSSLPLREGSGAGYSALVPNAKGLARALDAGVRHIAFFTAASETFTRRNIGMSIAESLEEFRSMMPAAVANGLRVRAYVSTAFVCPFEGKIAPAQVVPVVRALLDMGVGEISLGDTIGHAVPTDVAALLDALGGLLPLEKTALHFHNTRGAALANVLIGLQYGVSIFDASTGGTGGCPFAPGAAGNLATEELVTMLDGMGIETGVDIDRVKAAADFIQLKLKPAIGPNSSAL